MTMQSKDQAERLWGVANSVSRAVACAPTWAGIVTMMAVGVGLGMTADFSTVLVLDAVLWSISGFLIVSGFATIWVLRGRRHRYETVFLAIGVAMMGGAIMGRVYASGGPVWVGLHLVSASMLLWYLFMTVYLHTRKHYED